VLHRLCTRTQRIPVIKGEKSLRWQRSLQSANGAKKSQTELKLAIGNEAVVVQVDAGVDGMVCVGGPVGSQEFGEAFVKAKTIVEDVKQFQLLSDPGVHFELIRFCHNSRLAHLNKNLPPTTMAILACGV